MTKLRPFGFAKLIIDRKKYFVIHIPDKLAQMLELKKGESVMIYHATDERGFYARVAKPKGAK